MNEDGVSKSSRSTGPHRFEMEGWISCAPFERLLNMRIVEAADGRAVLTMPFHMEYAQGGGLMHGGALVSLADTAVVMAIKSIVPPQSHFATVLLEAKFLAPVKQGTVTARARVVHREGRVIMGHAEVCDEAGRVVVDFSSTFKVARDAAIRGITFQKGGA
ncbi:MAG: PaaI family thioesterase [Deltaproteobacteria bacterium]|nr:PaaI family thioesterase [Deltaproteobacteria bacterium]